MHYFNIRKVPFNRFLVVQAIVDGITLFTADALVAQPGPMQHVYFLKKRASGNPDKNRLNSQHSILPGRHVNCACPRNSRVKNGLPIRVGGLIKKGNTTNQSTIPPLGGIPLLGWAFK